MTQLKLFAQSPKPWKPHGYQKRAVKFLLEHACAALFLDLGLGKTSIILAAIKMLKKLGLLSKVLVIAPLRVCHNVWPVEVETWSDFAGLKVVVLHGPKKDKLLREDADIYVINPEGLSWLLDPAKSQTATGRTKVSVDVRAFKALGFDTLVVDELSKFKHTNTQRFKALKHVLPTFKRRWGATGSPAANSLMDLFGQCYVLDEGRTLGRYVSHFRSAYFDLGFDGFTWKIRPGAEDQIYKRLNPLALRMAADDYLDMPELVEVDTFVDLPPAARKVYDKIENDLIATLEDDQAVVAANAAVASMKCRQVASGGVYIDPSIADLVKAPAGKRDVAHLHHAKTEALADFVEELQGQPLLVAYEFAHDLERIRSELGKDIPYIGGGVTTKTADELIRAWNLGKLPILLAHPQSVAHGLNLQAGGNHICWYSLTWNYELYDQFIGRLRRQGSKAKTIFVHRILAKDTVDEVVATALRAKRSGQQALFDGLQALRKRRYH